MRPICDNSRSNIPGHAARASSPLPVGRLVPDMAGVYSTSWKARTSWAVLLELRLMAALPDRYSELAMIWAL